MYKLNRNETALLVIDMQEKIASVMDEDMLETAINNTAILVTAFQLMKLPIIETLQYPKGLGKTIEDLGEDLSPALRIEKMTFSAAKSDKLIGFLKEKGIKSLLLVGMEAHICVLQTALDLILMGFSVHVVADAVISRNDFNWETGLDMAQKAGAVVTVTETAIYQLLETAEAKEFKDIQRIITQDINE